MTPYEGACEWGEIGVPTLPLDASKRPLTPRGFYDATTEHDPAKWRDASLIGIRTGAASGYVVLDLDPRNGSDAWAAEHVASLPRTRNVRTGGGGRHYFFAYEPGMRCSNGTIAPGVDIKADGGYVADWSQRFPVENDGALAKLPAGLAQGSHVRHSADSDRDVSAPSVAAAVALLGRMPNDVEDYTTYSNIMLSARGCGDDPAIAEAACEWASRWSGSPGFETEIMLWPSKFGSADRNLAGWQSLLAHAKRLGVDVSAERAASVSEFDAIVDSTAQPVARSRKLRMRDRLFRPADCATSARRGYLIKGLLAPGDVAAIIGAPSTGKSTLAPFLAYGLAQGRSMFGLRTKPGRVLYIAAEDFAGMRQRIDALRRQHGDAADLALAETDSLLDTANAADLLDTVAHERPAFVVIDTVGAAFAGLDENDAAGMGMVVALARRIAATGAAVLLLHHVAKHGDGTPRGHSVLNGTLDMCLSLAAMDDDRIVRGRLTKNRNGSCDLDIAFRSTAVVLGTDEDGDDITAPLAAELANVPVRPAKLSGAEQQAVDILCEIGSGGPVAENTWREACDDRGVSTADGERSRRAAIGRVFRNLIDKGVVERSGGSFRIRAATTVQPSPFSACN